MSEELYARQHATYRTTHESIIIAANKLMAEQGFRAMNMIELASEAEVSRATLYNHFRDKSEVFMAFVETEIERIATLALIAQSRADALYMISREISGHPGLRRALETDGELIASALSIRDSQIWVDIYSELAKIFATDVIGVGMIVRWLLGQVTSPLSDEHSRQQADRLATTL